MTDLNTEPLILNSTHGNQINEKILNKNLKNSDNESGTYTIDDALTHIGSGPFQFFLMICVGLGWFTDAMEMLLLSFISPATQCEWDLTAAQVSWITSVVFIGMGFGAYILGIISDIYGRKKAFFISALITGFFGIITGFVPNYSLLLICRGFVGFGLGGAPIMFSMYSEFVPKENRGNYLALYQLLWPIGAILEVGIAWAVMPKYGWRGVAIVSSIPISLLCFIYPFIPESPRYLLLSGDIKKSTDVLVRISKMNKGNMPKGILAVPSYSENTSVQHGSGIKSVINELKGLFANPLHLVTPAIWFMSFALGLGYYAIVLLTTVAQVSDETETATTCSSDEIYAFSNSEYLSIFIDTLAEVPAVLLVVFIADCFTRVQSISTGFILSGIPLLLLIFFQSQTTVLLFFGRLWVSYNFVFLIIFMPEIYPTTIRSGAVGIANVFSRLGGFTAPFIAELLFYSYGLRTVCIFLCCFYFTAATWVILLSVETRGKALHETIEDLSQCSSFKPSNSDESNNSQSLQL